MSGASKANKGGTFFGHSIEATSEQQVATTHQSSGHGDSKEGRHPDSETTRGSDERSLRDVRLFVLCHPNADTQDVMVTMPCGNHPTG